MNWLSILGIVVVLVAVASLLGLNPRGGRQVASTRLMTVARIVLVLTGLVVVYVAWRK
jgi:hypothetical protein